MDKWPWMAACMHVRREGDRNECMHACNERKLLNSRW